MFDISTSKIKSIKKIEDGKTYDISVKKNHNFFCNDILVHNCDYRGPIGIVLMNTGRSVFTIAKGMRIAQAVLQKVERIEWDQVEQLEETERGSGGFGSTKL